MAKSPCYSQQHIFVNSIFPFVNKLIFQKKKVFKKFINFYVSNATHSANFCALSRSAWPVLSQLCYYLGAHLVCNITWMFQWLCKAFFYIKKTFFKREFENRDSKYITYSLILAITNFDFYLLSSILQPALFQCYNLPYFYTYNPHYTIQLIVVSLFVWMAWHPLWSLSSLLSSLWSSWSDAGLEVCFTLNLPGATDSITSP